MSKYELDVTHLVKSLPGLPPVIGSVAQYGENAASYTFNNAKSYCEFNPFLTNAAQIELARNHLRSMGCEEMDKNSDYDVEAMIVQCVALELKEDSGRVYQDDNGRYYYYLGE